MFNEFYNVALINESRINESNGTTNQQSIEKARNRTFAEDLLTPVQLKDFGKYPKNRNNCLLFIIHRV